MPWKNGFMALSATTRSGLFGQLLCANCILQLDNRILICGSLARKSTKQTKITWCDEKFEFTSTSHSRSLHSEYYSLHLIATTKSWQPLNETQQLFILFIYFCLHGGITLQCSRVCTDLRGSLSWQKMSKPKYFIKALILDNKQHYPIC